MALKHQDAGAAVRFYLQSEPILGRAEKFCAQAHLTEAVEQGENVEMGSG